MTFNIWDTAGHQDYRLITANFLRNSSGILLAFDLMRKETYESLKDWIQIIEEFSDGNAIVFLLGNKVDMCKEGEPRPIEPVLLETFIKENNINKYFEVVPFDPGIGKEQQEHQRNLPAACRRHLPRLRTQKEEKSPAQHECYHQKELPKGCRTRQRPKAEEGLLLLNFTSFAFKSAAQSLPTNRTHCNSRRTVC